MGLGEQQRKFTYAIATLIRFAYDELGVELTLGDAYRDPRVHGERGEKKGYGSASSNHKNRLALDLNLFVNEEYIKSSAHIVWKKLHIVWEQLGGAPAITNDANHFSFEWEGHR